MEIAHPTTMKMNRLPPNLLRFHCLRFGLSIVELAIRDSLSLNSYLESLLFDSPFHLSSLRTVPYRSSVASLG